MKSATTYTATINGVQDQTLIYICRTKAGYMYLHKGTQLTYVFNEPLYLHIWDTVIACGNTFYIHSKNTQNANN